MLAYVFQSIHVNFLDFLPSPSARASGAETRGLSRKGIIEGLRASLQRLQLDYVDILIVHKADPNCPMEGEPIGPTAQFTTALSRIAYICYATAPPRREKQTSTFLPKSMRLQRGKFSV